MTDPILRVRDLHVTFAEQEPRVRAVNGISFDVKPGETVALVGESGAGKSVAAMSILGLIPHHLAYQVTGTAHFLETDLLSATPRERRRVMGQDIGVVFQDPRTSLNPSHRIGDQISEIIRCHHPQVSRRSARVKAAKLLEQVGIPDAKVAIDRFPHEYSGGKRQRAMIAMAIANSPRLIVADEPTTALDVTVQAQVMEFLALAKEQTGAALLLITHDLALVGEVADRVIVMYAGRIVETGTAEAIFREPRHPYTQALMGSIPKPDGPNRPLRPIPGHPPDARDLPPGCSFEPRCQLSRGRAECKTMQPALHPLAPGRGSACHFHRELQAGSRATSSDITLSPRTESVDGVSADSGLPVPAGVDAGTGTSLLEVDGLSKHYLTRRLFSASRQPYVALDGVSFGIARGETLALVGESGCGKTTTARIVGGLLGPSSGSVWYTGTQIAGDGHRPRGATRRDIQIVFQDPYASLNPRRSIFDAIAEPLRIQRELNSKSIKERVDDTLESVGLNPRHANRYPYAFSGGQRQRIAIARALVLEPKLLILDEPVSALDVSIQAQIVNLLMRLQIERDLTYLFISHDLSVVKQVADRIAVMYMGRVVELGTADDVYERPNHPYTQALLSAIPLGYSEDAHRRRIVLRDDLPGQAAPVTGCRFRKRCWMADELCEQEPELTRRGGHPQVSACHYVAPNVRQAQ